MVNVVPRKPLQSATQARRCLIAGVDSGLDLRDPAPLPKIQGTPLSSFLRIGHRATKVRFKEKRNHPRRPASYSQSVETLRKLTGTKLQQSGAGRNRESPLPALPVAG
jgi:hypothetical protein